jgi:hypothetical protein
VHIANRGAPEPTSVLTALPYPPIVSPTALTIAFLLAVFKPWGRIRRRTVDQ